MTQPFDSHKFASDNTSGICPEAWASLAEANRGDLPSYGTDDWTKRACDRIRDIFEKPEAEIFFVFNGTAANSLALASLCQSFHSVVCHEVAHVETDECGAPEFFSNGTKILTATGTNGKLTPASVEQVIRKRTDIHYPKARVLSLTQSTECGTVYSTAEIKALSAVAREHGLLVHMDGARFANAAAVLQDRDGSSPADFTWRAGVDVLCFGGTKNGMNTSEAVVFFRPELAHEFDYRCKQAGQLASKMRYLSSQWVGMLSNDNWLRHARHANTMAYQLGETLRTRFGLTYAVEPEVNAVFAPLPDDIAAAMQARGWHFYNFIGAQGYRLMCSWDTQQEDLDRFVADLAEEYTSRA
ncbi:threonine aldolase family protein [Synoicihabitans lomoniglobus]|uniref:L-threonine aldolase n=1 Tax=Synoicihabitans lomoniglobus TaxID=2909285 RepID=A0AAF0CSV3_9BACT|nr:low specificity L-threonine aldolase [Opitutaceae bacterium LMO-M01]WED67429.1 low specificity L-threonine aldolase [Opitutaceae bacterium LMO-M01]